MIVKLVSYFEGSNVSCQVRSDYRKKKKYLKKNHFFLLHYKNNLEVSDSLLIPDQMDEKKTRLCPWQWVHESTVNEECAEHKSTNKQAINKKIRKWELKWFRQKHVDLKKLYTD